MITDRPTQTVPARTVARLGAAVAILSGAFLVLAMMEGHRPSSLDLSAARELTVGKGTD